MQMGVLAAVTFRFAPWFQYGIAVFFLYLLLMWDGWTGWTMVDRHFKIWMDKIRAGGTVLRSCPECGNYLLILRRYHLQRRSTAASRIRPINQPKIMIPSVDKTLHIINNRLKRLYRNMPTWRKDTMLFQNLQVAFVLGPNSVWVA